MILLPATMTPIQQPAVPVPETEVSKRPAFSLDAGLFETEEVMLSPLPVREDGGSSQPDEARGELLHAEPHAIRGEPTEEPAQTIPAMGLDDVKLHDQVKNSREKPAEGEQVKPKVAQTAAVAPDVAPVERMGLANTGQSATPPRQPDGDKTAQTITTQERRPQMRFHSGQANDVEARTQVITSKDAPIIRSQTPEPREAAEGKSRPDSKNEFRIAPEPRIQSMTLVSPDVSGQPKPIAQETPIETTKVQQFGESTRNPSTISVALASTGAGQPTKPVETAHSSDVPPKPDLRTSEPPEVTRTTPTQSPPPVLATQIETPVDPARRPEHATQRPVAAIRHVASNFPEREPKTPLVSLAPDAPKKAELPLKTPVAPDRNASQPSVPKQSPGNLPPPGPSISVPLPVSAADAPIAVEVMSDVQPPAALPDSSPPRAMSDVAPSQPQTRPPDVAQTIIRQLTAHAHTLSDRPVEITLNPEELGRVRMVLSGSEGQMVVHIQVEKTETGDLMRRHLNMLAEDFQSLGYSDVSFSFSGQNRDPEHDKSPHSNPSEILTSDEEPEHVQRIMIAQSGIDLRL